MFLGCRGLVELNLRDCVQVSDHSLKALAVVMRPGALVVSGADSAGSSGGGSGGGPQRTALHLRVLDVSGCHKITDEGLSYFLPPPAIPTAASHSITAAPPSSQELTAVRQLLLQRLDTYSLPAASDHPPPPQSLIDALTSASSTATEAGSSGGTRINNEAYGVGAGYGYNEVESLVLGGCTRLTDRGCRVMAVCFPNLKRVSLYGCNRVTDAGVMALLGAFRLQLTELTLSGCVQLTDRTLHALLHYAQHSDEQAAPPHNTSASSAPASTATSTSTFTSTSPATISATAPASASACAAPSERGRLHRTLTVLELEDCSLFTDAGLAAAIEPLLELRVLRLKGNTTFTAASNACMACAHLC